MEAKLTKPCYKLFHQFKLKDRVITLCCVTEHAYTSIRPGYITTLRHYVGISITNPADKYDEKLGRKIAEDRASYNLKNDIKKHIFKYDGDELSYGMLLAYLKECEERIRLEPEKYIPSLSNKKKK